ncbi:MAG TPA: hypothetical protein DCY24_07140 [Rikenellaceae bacterium]|nr:hypothetical protein [Rikenellaceae bacterium]
MRYLYSQSRKMKIRNIILTGLSAAMFALPSCKKDKDSTTTKDYVSGTLVFSSSVPTYVRKGDAFSLTPSGITHPGTGLAEDVGYYWSRSWESAKDTTKAETDKSGDGTFKFTVPSKVGTFTVSCVAFANGYYTKSNTASFSVVDPALDSTVTGAYTSKDTKFTDPRDGGSYYTTTFNGKTWMKNNLYYSGSGVSYENSEAMDAIFGRYYTWNEAVNACPEGWHLPSEKEFVEMANALAPAGTAFAEKETFTNVAGGLMVDARFLGTRMWEYWPQVKITNKSGFSVLPVGYANDSGSSPKFTGLNSYAMLWTSTSDSEDYGFCRYIYVKQNDVLVGARDKKSFRASVRCIKD